MSTILNALQKAKQAPQKESVDARREILSSEMHDYLAAVPDDPGARNVLLRRILIAASVLIGLLLVAVVVLLIQVMTSEPPAHAGDAPLSDPSAAALPPPVQTPVLPTPTPAPAQPSGGQESVVRIVVETSDPPPAVERDALETPLRFDDPYLPDGPPEIEPEPVATLSPEDIQAAERRRLRREVDALRITGIIVDADSQPMAMINGKTVGVGSRIGEAVVQEIHDDRVVVEIDGETFTVWH